MSFQNLKMFNCLYKLLSLSAESLKSKFANIMYIDYGQITADITAMNFKHNARAL